VLEKAMPTLTGIREQLLMPVVLEENQALPMKLSATRVMKKTKTSKVSE
jgi:hypothetical protein